MDSCAFCTHPTDGAGQHSGRPGRSIVPAGGSCQRQEKRPHLQRGSGVRQHDRFRCTCTHRGTCGFRAAPGRDTWWYVSNQLLDHSAWSTRAVSYSRGLHTAGNRAVQRTNQPARARGADLLSIIRTARRESVIHTYTL